MNEEPYYMRTMFLENMSGTHKALYIVDKLIKRHLKKLAAFFQRENIEVSMVRHILPASRMTSPST